MLFRSDYKVQAHVRDVNFFRLSEKKRELIKGGNIYGEKENITLGVVDVPIEKQIAIDKASTKGLKSEEYANNSENKLDKLRKLRRGN